MKQIKTELKGKILALKDAYTTNLEQIGNIRLDRIKRKEFDSPEEIAFIDGKMVQLLQNLVDLEELVK